MTSYVRVVSQCVGSLLLTGLLCVSLSAPAAFAQFSVGPQLSTLGIGGGASFGLGPGGFGVVSRSVPGRTAPGRAAAGKSTAPAHTSDTPSTTAISPYTTVRRSARKQRFGERKVMKNIIFRLRTGANARA